MLLFFSYNLAFVYCSSNSEDDDSDSDDVYDSDPPNSRGDKDPENTSEYGSRSVGSESNSGDEASGAGVRVEKSFSELKEEGNEKYSKEDHRMAIELYEKAIIVGNKENVSDEEKAKCYSNIACVHIKRKDWKLCLAAAFKAIAIKPDFVRSYIRCSKAFEGIYEQDSGFHNIKKLQCFSLLKGMSYCNKSNSKMQEDLDIELKRLSKEEPGLEKECRTAINDDYENHPKNIDLELLFEQYRKGRAETLKNNAAGDVKPKDKEETSAVIQPPGLTKTDSSEDSTHR